jgi:hypothetical protein
MVYVDRKLIAAILIVLLVIIIIYLYLGSSTPPENVTYPVSQANHSVNGSNVSRINLWNI